MSSADYEYDDEDYYDDEDMIDGDQDSDDDMDMDFNVSAGPTRKTYEIDYESLSKNAVEKLMQQDIDHCCGILGADASTSALLLRHLGWNKERLIEKYMDNPSSVLVAAGISMPEPPSSPTLARTASHSPAPARRSTRSSSAKLLSAFSPSKKSEPLSRPTKSFNTSVSEMFSCPVCCDDAPDLQPLSLDCGHTFCNLCWRDYIQSKVIDESEHSVRCMQDGCAMVAPDTFVHSTSDETTWDRFREIVLRHFVGSNAHLKYCPYPGCTNTVACPSAASRSSLSTIVPTVSCGARGVITEGVAELQENGKQESLSLAGKEHRFCFGCPIEDDHRPVICAVAKMWMKKCQDDSETANWIKSNTKECTKCLSTIEKNGGCNHMTCKKCKHEFCWVCMGPWSEHGTAWYSCNRYDEKSGLDARDSQSKSRVSLERYLHYYNRWANHEQSAKLSVDLYAKTEKKMEDMQITSALTWIEVQFMKKAVEEVEKCRMTLKWTYAMAYYLAKGNHKDLFEDNQRDLEKAVEDLSELLEGPVEAEMIAELRQKVTDKTVYVGKRNEIVLEDTAVGLLESRWRWNMPVEGFDDPEEHEKAI